MLLWRAARIERDTMNNSIQARVEGIPSKEGREGSSLRARAEFFDRLQRRIEATKAIRFQATVRLVRRHKLSAYVTAMLSLYVIGLSLIPNIFVLQPRQSQALLACTIVMSTFIVVLILTEGYESFYHKAEVLHESARQLNKLAFKMSQFAVSDSDAEDLIEKISTEYESIIENSRVNHAECDYLRIRANRPDLFGFNAPTPPTTILAKAWLNCIRILDWSQSIIREYLWLFLPLTFTIFASYTIYFMIAYGWPPISPG